ncbi:MAG TPA: aldolase/citrate lyase family protein [Xanthobacteraceae bacterium]|nr:aldolase/citrate lyase family protein [Xanthobacteraceae bacterium]
MTASESFSLADQLRAGETVYSGWCGLASPLVAEVIAREGFSAVTIDMQHGLWDITQIVSAIAAIRHGGGAPVVRVPLGDFATASRALDFGAEGIISPMINTAADARAFVASTKYPPVGERSWGPHRATMLGGLADQKVYLKEGNTLTFTLAMIETRAALDNVAAIAATPGIDGLFLGPSDLSIALSQGATIDPLSPDVDRELERIAEAARKAGKIMGAYCHTADRAVALAKRGVRFLAVGSDLGFLRAGSAAALKTLKG